MKNFKILVGLLLTSITLTATATNISEAVADGPIQTTGSGNDLSGVAYGKTGDGVAGLFTVDNKTGVLTYPGGTCTLGGDLEAVSAGEVDGEFYIVNEGMNGIRVINVATASNNSCSDIRKAKVNNIGTGGSDGLEGLVYHNDWLYYIDERSATIYKSPAIFSGSSIDPEIVFTVPDCFLGSGLSINDNNLVIACDNTDTNASGGTLLEYTVDGNYVSRFDVPDHGNMEGVTFNGNQMIIVAEANFIQYFTLGDPADPTDPVDPDPIDEVCTVTGTATHTFDTGALVGDLVVDCPSRQGTAILDSNLD